MEFQKKTFKSANVCAERNVMWIRWNDKIIHHFRGNLQIQSDTTQGGLVCVTVKNAKSGISMATFITNYPTLLMDKIWQAIEAQYAELAISESDLRHEDEGAEGDKFGDADKLDDDGVVGD